VLCVTNGGPGAPYRCRGAARRLVASLLVAATLGCAHQPEPTHPRPALPLPNQIANRYALPGPVIEESFVPIGDEDGLLIFRGQLACGDELADFHFIRPANDPNAPFVICLPILAGGDFLMWLVATELAQRGYATAWTARLGSALSPPQRGPDLERLFRRTVLHNRILLAWARRSADIDRDRMGCVGISMGGIVGGVLMALEPGLRGGALCLAGGDIAGMLMVSRENRVVEWRRWRHLADGASGAELLRELREDLVSDPAFLGPYVPTEKVLLVGSSFDEVVPPVHQEMLWESLGRPQRDMLPLGHYTSALAFGAMLSRVDRFLGQRLEPIQAEVADVADWQGQ